MTNLIIDSLSIRNFRSLAQLSVNRLGRVNLITGKNNTGKTSFLEALWLYARSASPEVLKAILAYRDEANSRIGANAASGEGLYSSRKLEDVQSLNLKYLFRGRKEIDEDISPIIIGKAEENSDRLVMSIGWYQQTTDKDESGEVVRRLKRLNITDALLVEGSSPYFVALKGGVTFRRQLSRFFASPLLSTPLDSSAIPCQFVRATNIDTDEIGFLWDSIALTELEDEVNNGLRLIAPEVQRVNLVQGDRGRGRFPIVKTDADLPIPLRSMGDGMSRLFNIVLALVNARNGFLLMDEVENGLHYSVQPDVWRLIFTVAARLNVQVFATTHSWDCISAFQEAAQEDGAEGVLVRLQNKNGDILSTIFDERRLAIATQEQIEVR